MSKKTRFQEKWLQATDCNKIRVSQWAKQDSTNPYNCLCSICGGNFSIAKGFEKIQQHAATTKHKKNLFKLDENQLRFSTPQSSLAVPSESRSAEPRPAAIFNPREAATRAELLWCMETIKTDSSVNSCAGKRELFQVMFPNSMAQSFSLSPSKVQYLLTEALGPYFKNQMLDDLHSGDVYFSLQYDETSNVESKKELQIQVRFWSSPENMIIDRHLITYFIGKADGETIFNHLLKALDSHNLSSKNVLTLGSDGPNVNKKVLRLFQERLKELHYKPLIDLGTCQLHIVHNAFLKGLDCLSEDVSDFIIKVYYFFHHRDLRCEDFEKIQVKLKLPPHKFIKHISTRWLTVGPAAERMLEQFEALEEYFLQFIPKKQPATAKKQNYIDIRSYLKNTFLKCTLQMIVYLSKIFTTEFTLIMQKEEPLIQVLYVQLKKLLLLLLSSVTKSSALTSNLLDSIDIEAFFTKTSHFLDLSDLQLGETVQSSLAVLSQKDKLFLSSEFKKMFTTSVKHIVNKVKSFNTLKYFQCLSPENIKNPDSVKYITKIAKLLPLTNIDVDKLSCEWRLLQIDDEVTFSLKEFDRIDSYWNTVFSLKTGTNTRFPVIQQVVQAALALTHGSADVERGFSKSARIITDERSRMKERMLNARLSIIDGLKKYNGQVYTVPITNVLLKLAHNAHHSYQMYLDDERRLIEKKNLDEAMEIERAAKERAILENIENENKTIKSLEVDLKTAQNSYNDAVNDSESIQKTLNSVLKSKASTVVVQEVFSSLEKLRCKEKEKRIEVDKIRQNINKRKSLVMESFIAKKKKI